MPRYRISLILIAIAGFLIACSGGKSHADREPAGVLTAEELTAAVEADPDAWKGDYIELSGQVAEIGENLETGKRFVNLSVEGQDFETVRCVFDVETFPGASALQPGATLHVRGTVSDSEGFDIVVDGCVMAL